MKKVLATKQEFKKLKSNIDFYQKETNSNFETILEMLQEHIQKIDDS